MTYLQTKNYRLQSISRVNLKNKNKADLDFIELPVSDGLGIEYRYYDSRAKKESYYVVCFIEYDKKHKKAVINDLNIDDLLAIENNEFYIFKEFVKTAKQLVETANIEDIEQLPKKEDETVEPEPRYEENGIPQ